MFHAHQSEFAQLGWMGFFEVDADGGARSGRRATTGGRRGRLPAWLLGLIPLVLIAVAVARVRGCSTDPGLGERNGPPVEELAVERTVLQPGEIELTRAQRRPRRGARSRQVIVNDGFADFTRRAS